MSVAGSEIARSEIKRKRAAILGAYISRYARISEQHNAAYVDGFARRYDADLSERAEIFDAFASRYAEIVKRSKVAYVDGFARCLSDGASTPDYTVPDAPPPDKPRNIDKEIRGPPRRAPSFTKRSRAAIAIARSEGCPGVRITMPDGTTVNYVLRPDALDPRYEVNPFNAPLLPAKRGRS